MDFQELSLHHMAWANNRIYTEVAALPVECLKATYGPADWTVADILRHMVSGYEWYNFLLTGAQWKDLKAPTTAAEVLELRDYKMAIGKNFFEQAKLPDETIEFQDENGPGKTTRVMLLNQAVYHSTEHRAHIATAIEVQGIGKIDLDSYDFWNHAPFAGN